MQISETKIRYNRTQICRYCDILFSIENLGQLEVWERDDSLRKNNIYVFYFSGTRKVDKDHRRHRVFYDDSRNERSGHRSAT